MALKVYDILKDIVLPDNFFIKDSSILAGLLRTDPVPIQIKAKNTGPFSDLPETSLIIRVDESEDFTITFAEDFPNPATIQEVIDEINNVSIFGDIASQEGGRLVLTSPLELSIEIMFGSSILGLYETDDPKAYIKVLSPSLDEVRDLIQDYDIINDPDRAPKDFLKELGKLMGYEWREGRDSDLQRRIIRERPYENRIRGTERSGKRIIKLLGGEIFEVFKAHDHISRYEEDVVDGNKVFNTPGSRAYYEGSVSSSEPTTFTDSVNSPFISDDEHRFLCISDLPGPVGGFKISRVISTSQVELNGASFDSSESSLKYQILDPPRGLTVLGDRNFWHEGVFEITSDIPPDFYKKDILDVTKPEGRKFFYVFLVHFDHRDPEAADITSELELGIDLPIFWYSWCGQEWDGLGEIDVLDPNEGLEGCEVVRIETIVDFLIKGEEGEHAAVARPRIAWSQLFTFEDMTLPAYFVRLYNPEEDFNTVDFLPDGYTWEYEYTDFQPDTHVITSAFSGNITRGAGSTDSLVGIMPEGSQILLVNQGGTPDTDNDVFTGGTDYSETTDWVQDGDEIDWSPGGSEPGVSTTYRVFYQHDQYNLIDWS